MRPTALPTARRPELWPAVQARRDEEMAAARAALGDAAFERAWAEGRSLSLEQAIDDALAVVVAPDQGTTARDGATAAR